VIIARASPAHSADTTAAVSRSIRSIIAKIRDGKAYEVWEIADTGTMIRQLTDGE
jgi:hypothetical protein